MIRTVDGDAERFLSALQASQSRASRALDQISTGYRVQFPSDSAGDVMDIIRLGARISQGDQVKANLSLAKSEAEISDTTVQTSIDLLENALQIGAEATDATLTAELRAGLALQVQQIHQQVLSLTRLNIQGRYVFSGDRDQQAQYELDPADTVTGVKRLFQAGESRQVSDMVGGSFQAALTAESVFDHRTSTDAVADDNAFAALSSLNQALLNNDTTQIAGSIEKVKLALEHLNASLTFYGGVETRIASSTALVEKYQLQWKQSLSEKKDADLIQAQTDLQSAQTQQDAALAARARFSGHSLFDFLS